MIQNKIDFTYRPLHINVTNLAFQFGILQYLLLTHVSTWGIILPYIIPVEDSVRSHQTEPLHTEKKKLNCKYTCISLLNSPKHYIISS